MMKKFDDTEVEEVVEPEPKEVYKDDGWWSKITERINKVSECVNSGKDLEVDDEENEDNIDEVEDAKKLDKNEDESQHKEYASLKHRMDRTENSLDSLGNIEYCFQILFLH